MSKLSKVLESYWKSIEEVVETRNEKRASKRIWFNKSVNTNGVWQDTAIQMNDITDVIDDGFIVNMFIKDIDTCEDEFVETTNILSKAKFMLAEGTVHHCKNDTLRYMVVSTEE
jgi:hypothetical protein|tara:strand:+ start:9124 stop:9465 length:342 start_codon:yes stop_codon:yes gene_type:complete